MGRPINKRYFGATGDNTQPTIPVRYHNGSSSVEGYIVNQKGTNKFTVTTNGTDTYVCRLVNELAPNAAEEMSLVGLTDGGNNVILKKMFNRTAVDYDNNRYTWEVEDDSTESLLRLTAI
jgi:hypothetical protein